MVGFGLAVGLCVLPLTAQRNTFGEIFCTKVTVVDSEDKFACRISGDDGGGTVFVYNMEAPLAGIDGGLLGRRLAFLGSELEVTRMFH